MGGTEAVLCGLGLYLFTIVQLSEEWDHGGCWWD